MEIEQIPHTCPVCNGDGTLSKLGRKTPKDETCHACFGRGIVMGSRIRFTSDGYRLKSPFDGSLLRYKTSPTQS